MQNRTNVLVVDDEIDVLEGLEQHLRRRYRITKATSGAQGLDELKKGPPFAVVMSDMRMPKMDGATFLAKAKQLAPDSVRMLLTGHTEIDAAISAVNDGQIFRFLTKPCPPTALMGAFGHAVRQHKLICAERELLEQTLLGSVQALADVLSLTNPALFGRASRIKRQVSQIADAIALKDRWQVEVAAILSQLGHVTLPPEIADKVYYGQALNAKEKKMVDGSPAVTKRLIEKIPRLEPVLEILDAQETPFDRKRRTPSPPAGARILKIASDFDVLETQGCAPQLALDTMRSRDGLYDPELLQALSQALGLASDQVQSVCELPLSALKPGMVLAEDIKTTAGTLFVSRGYEVTDRFIERTKNFNKGFIVEPVRVIISASTTSDPNSGN